MKLINFSIEIADTEPGILRGDLIMSWKWPDGKVVQVGHSQKEFPLLVLSDWHDGTGWRQDGRELVTLTSDAKLLIIKEDFFGRGETLQVVRSDR